MVRFLVPPTAIQGKRFHLTGSEAHHASHVLRKKIGDTINLFDGQDRSFQGQITSILDDRIEGVILEETAAAPTLLVSIILYQALVKSSKWDWLIEKACEVGVAEVVPVLSQRTIVKWKKEDKPKIERWNRIAVAASKQSGRGAVMPVKPPVPFDQAVADAAQRGTVLIPWEKETTHSIAKALAGENPKTVSIFIGPEGGWDPAEVDRAKLAGAIPTRLGPTLLRTETAGLVAATLVLREFGIY